MSSLLIVPFVKVRFRSKVSSSKLQGGYVPITRNVSLDVSYVLAVAVNDTYTVCNSGAV